jgi:hypothetical protein
MSQLELARQGSGIAEGSICTSKQRQASGKAACARSQTNPESLPLRHAADAPGAVQLANIPHARTRLLDEIIWQRRMLLGV